MSIPICEHIKPSGDRCGSPAERGAAFCFYHSKVRKLVPRTNLFVFDPGNGRCNPDDPYNECEFPLLEDPAGIQIGFMQVIHGVVQRRFRPWETRAVLSALHGAAANLRQMDKALPYSRRTAKKPAASVEAGQAAQKQLG